MLCENKKDYIERYRDCALGPELQSAIAGHLKACSGCRAAYSEADTIKAFFNGSALFSVPKDTAAAIIAAVQSSNSKPKAGRPLRESFPLFKGDGR